MKPLALLALFALSSAHTDTILERFKIPAGYTQLPVAQGSFAQWLQQLPLKPAGTHTLTYRGDVALTDAYTAGVVDISVGKEDLQQCADVVMRLRGEYLYNQNRYSEIAFHFSDGFLCDYLHYADGYRIRKGKWVLTAKKDYGYATFMEYMRLVFAYCGTLSLQKELHPVKDPAQIAAGDVFIRGGSPGHCFIVLDVVEDAAHHRQFLLGQSFMPAQNLQILQSGGSPWFSLDNIPDIPYGELVSMKYLKSFD